MKTSPTASGVGSAPRERMPTASTLEGGARSFLPLKSAGLARGDLAPSGLRRPPSWMARPTRPSLAGPEGEASIFLPMDPPRTWPSSG